MDNNDYDKLPDEEDIYTEPDDEKDDILPFEEAEGGKIDETSSTTDDPLTNLDPDLEDLIHTPPGKYVKHNAYLGSKRIKHPNMLSFASNKRVRRTLADREHDLVFEADLYLKGYSHVQIADELSKIRPYNIKRNQVGNDIQELYRRWQNSYLSSINELKVRELARIDRLEAEYWSAWEKSQKDFVSIKQDRTADETMTKTTVRGEDGHSTEAAVLKPSFSRTKTTTEKEERVGDPRFLEGVERCVTMRIKLLGLEPAKSVNINWRKQAEAEGINPENVVNGLVEQFIRAAETGLDGSGGSGSLGESPEPD